jgi:RNA polymerase sigma-70 factor, ECF subfamily
MSVLSFGVDPTEAMDLPVAAGQGAGPEPLTDSDAVLMMETAAGSESAFTELVHRYQNPLLNFFARMGATLDSEDLVQETFVRLYRYRDRYQPSARFTGLLYHLARNVWADRGRKDARHARLTSGLRLETTIISEPDFINPGERLDVDAALEKLSPKLREAIVLNVYQRLRYQEIADILGIPLGTVKSRINLALAALKEHLHEN